MQEYKCLNNQVFSNDKYSLVPIRFEDQYDIMQWRNEQIYHLRQVKPLTKEDQIAYFENVVAKLFHQEQPNQILFSYLEGDRCIGYGGLVHINWIDKNAEVSFIMDTRLEFDYFRFHWNNYLQLLKRVAFDSLNLHKTYVYAFDLRPHLYTALDEAGYFFDCRLKDHCFYNNEFKDVVIYSLINK
jgi:RimJ/RimL family protein N-acetyltransferase